ncbi:unnamed protein product [Mytilus coruscus]|uniref:C2H2-type domain-containing protein n=1 Tax=Mytilus coruscus TaxID=42192 RepID=A0A6J8BQU4_MYTCO|nr:unnamed protein product [Mytilus coruscus]
MSSNNSGDMDGQQDCSVPGEIPIVRRGRRPNRPPPARRKPPPKIGLDITSMRQQQEEDDIMGEILKLKIENAEKPSTTEISSKSKEFKFWISRWELLEVRNDVLCLYWVKNNCAKWRVCAPKSAVSGILWYLHDARTSGHLGIKKTVERAHICPFYWWSMQRSERKSRFAGIGPGRGDYKKLSDVLYRIQHAKNSPPHCGSWNNLKLYRGSKKLKWFKQGVINENVTVSFPDLDNFLQSEDSEKDSENAEELASDLPTELDGNIIPNHQNEDKCLENLPAISKSPQKPEKEAQRNSKIILGKSPEARKTEAQFPHLKLISISPDVAPAQENQNSGKDKHYTTRKGRQIKVPEKFKDFIATMSSAKLFDCVDCGKEYVSPRNLKRHRNQKHSEYVQCRCCPYEDCTKMYCRIEYMTYHLKVKHKLSSEQAKRKSKSCPVVRKSRTEFEESRRSTVSLQNAIPDSPPEAQIELENQYQVPDVLDILVNNNEFDNIEDLIGEVSEIREANEFNLEGFFDDNCDSRDVSINVSNEGCSDNVMNTPTYCVPDNIQENNININNMYEDISSPENLEEFTCTNDDQMETGLEDLVYESDDNASICSSLKSTSTDSSNTKDEIVESVEIISISLIKTVTEVAGVKQVRTEQKFSFTG